MGKIRITTGLTIDDNELDESFILAAGPGGQNVNKVASAVQLRFDVIHSPSLPGHVRDRMIRLAGNRLTKSGELVLVARRHRSQERNRADVRARLVALIRAAAIPPKSRRETKPSLASRKLRLEEKSARGALKRLRGKPRAE